MSSLETLKGDLFCDCSNQCDVSVTGVYKYNVELCLVKNRDHSLSPRTLLEGLVGIRNNSEGHRL